MIAPTPASMARSRSAWLSEQLYPPSSASHTLTGCPRRRPYGLRDVSEILRRELCVGSVFLRATCQSEESIHDARLASHAHGRVGGRRLAPCGVGRLALVSLRPIEPCVTSSPPRLTSQRPATMMVTIAATVPIAPRPDSLAMTTVESWRRPQRTRAMRVRARLSSWSRDRRIVDELTRSAATFRAFLVPGVLATRHRIARVSDGRTNSVATVLDHLGGPWIGARQRGDPALGGIGVRRLNFVAPGPIGSCVPSRRLGLRGRRARSTG
jgi:hypothetical protein